MPTIDLFCNGTNGFHVSDTWGEGNAAPSGRNRATTSSNLRFGRDGKTDSTRWTFLRFGERDSGTTASGIGIPARAIILDAEITFTSKLTDTNPFSAAFTVLAEDGLWDNLGTPRWTTQDFPGQATTVDFHFIASGTNDTNLIFEMDSGATSANTTFAGEIDDPTGLGQVFTIASGTAESVVSNFGVRIDATGTATPDWDTFIELYKVPVGSTNPDDAGSVLLGKSDSISHSNLTGDITSYTYYPFTETVTLSGNTNSSNLYFWNFHIDKPDPQTSDNSKIILGIETDNPTAFVTPAVSGLIHDGFSRDQYPFTLQLPFVFEDDNSTSLVVPFGSTVNAPFSNWTTTETEFVASGLALLVQEWVDDPGYDPNAPMGWCVGPGDSDENEVKEAYSTTISGSSTDPKLTITYRPRRTNIT